jgi:copper chaperone
MDTLNLHVTGMSCMGCVNSVKKLVGAFPGVTRVDIDLASGQVVIDYDPASVLPQQLRQAIEDGGYGIA